MSLPGRGPAIPLDGVHCLYRIVRRPHWKASPAKTHDAAAAADREDDPALGIRPRAKSACIEARD
jgi:hypothetical protein